MMPPVTKSSLWLVLALATLGNGGPVRAQGLARQVERASDGWVAFRYAIDRDVQVCRGGGMSRGRSWRMTRRNGNGRCTAGLAEARLRVRGGVVTDIEIQPPESPVSGLGSRSDLGERDASEVGEYFLSLARESSRGSVAEDAIMPATIAEGFTAWPHLRNLARTTGLDEEVRHAAVFWLSQEDEEEALDALASIFELSDDVDIREKAIFAISQHPSPRSIDWLLERAEDSDESKRVRKQVLFWLGQSDDPRVADFLVELIRGRVIR
jgi:hypothetical protein